MSGSFKCLSPSSKRFKMKREFCFKLINSPSVQAEMERATSAKDAFFPSLMHLMEDAFNEKVASNLAKDDEIEDLRRELGDARSKINKLEKKLAGLTGKACQTVNRKSDNLLPNSPLVKRGDAGPSMSSTPKRARLEMKLVTKFPQLNHDQKTLEMLILFLFNFYY